MSVIFIFLSLSILKFVTSQDCQVCQELVTEFQVGLKNSEKGNFGGGNTAWEESRLGTFATSETRLIHIIENLCPSSLKNREKCQYLREAVEEHIERWWMEVYRKEGQEGASLYGFLCVNILQVCCHNNHYGEKCERCKEWSAEGEGGVLCGGHGYCNGNGTRGGDGTCVCLEGYSGVACGECADNYYNNSNEGGECAACDIGCSGGCRGPHSCVSCKEGYQMVLNNLDSDSGSDTGRCDDVNECSADSQLCRGEGQRCRNTEGGYTCDCEDNYDKVEKDGSCKLRVETTEKTTESKQQHSSSTNDNNHNKNNKKSIKNNNNYKIDNNGNKSNKKPRQSKKIWTRQFEREFFKLLASIIVLGVICYFFGRYSVIVTVAGVACGYFVYYKSVKLDLIFSKSVLV